MDIKQLRMEMNVTQQQLADMCKVTLRTVQNWEGGYKPIPESKKLLLEAISEKKGAIISDSNSQIVTKEAGQNADHLPEVIERFFETTKKQHELNERQLQEIQEMNRIIAKKDEQIDVLLKWIVQKG